MKKFKFLTLAAFLFLSVDYLWAQSATPTPARRPQVNELDNLRPPDDLDRNVSHDRRSIENFPAVYRVSSKALKKAQITDEEKEFYRDVRKSKGLKILKIFAAPACADKFAVDVSDSRCAEAYDFLPISFYSFFDGEYGEIFSDFRIAGDLLIAGSGQYVHGFLMDTGETDIGTLDKKSPQVKMLADYPIAKTLNDTDKQKSELAKGISYQNEILSSRKKMIPNHAYILRIIAYVPPNKNATQYNYDAVFAFKVDKVDKDNMVIILWNKLSEKIAPGLKNK